MQLRVLGFSYSSDLNCKKTRLPKGAPYRMLSCPRIALLGGPNHPFASCADGALIGLLLSDQGVSANTVPAPALPPYSVVP